jgi:hypothetical protein
MLVGLDGGAARGEAPRTVGQALEAYACERLADPRPGEEQGIQVALEVLTAFFHDEHAELVSGSAAGRRPGAGTLGLPARCLLRGLHASVHLFPYSCVVSSAVIGRFAAEVRALASWSARIGLCGSRELARFRRGFHEAMVPMRRHRRMQHSIEGACAPYVAAMESAMVQGRFRVEEVDALGVRVTVPDRGAAYRVRVPREVREAFRAGQAVSLAMFERAMGWSPVGMSLPADPEWLEGHCEQLERLPWPWPALPLREALPPNGG